jgi:hypothetical protein
MTYYKMENMFLFQKKTDISKNCKAITNQGILQNLAVSKSHITRHGARLPSNTLSRFKYV